MEESLQPSRELVSDINTGTDIICIKDELTQGKHEVNDDEVCIDHSDDKTEGATMNQYTGNDHYARKTVDNIQPYDHGKLVEELL